MTDKLILLLVFLACLVVMAFEIKLLINECKLYKLQKRKPREGALKK